VALFARSQYPGHEGTNSMDHTPQVDVENLLPILQGKFPDISSIYNASIIYGNVQYAEMFNRFRRNSLDLGLVTNVGHNAVYFPALLTELLDRFGEHGGISIGENDPHPFIDERRGNGAPDTAGRTGYHRNALLQNLHAKG
jgi:hypothetical protein